MNETEDLQVKVGGKRMRILGLATALLLSLPLAAQASQCSADLRIGGQDALRDYSLNIHPNGPQPVSFQYFGSISEIQLYSGGLLYYRGTPIPSFNAPGPFTLLVLHGNPGDVVRINTDWSLPPTGCR